MRDLGDGFSIRQATAGDHPALSMICLRTGDVGADATGREDDPRLLGLIYALPYQVLEPDFAFLVEGPAGPCGYVLGALDTIAFNARLASEWYPALQQEIDDPGDDPPRPRGSDWARRLIHRPDFSVPPNLAPFPSHGHIDLLPEARGRGIGRQAMDVLETALRRAGSTGLFLEVAPRNRDALAFYARVGFSRLTGPGVPRRSVFMIKSCAPREGGPLPT